MTKAMVALDYVVEARERQIAKNERAYCNIAGNIYTAPVRLVLDTAAMVAAIRSDAGASRRLLVAALEQRFTLLVSVALMLEYEAVMTRKQHLAASKLSAEDVGILLDGVASVGELFALPFGGGLRCATRMMTWCSKWQ